MKWYAVTILGLLVAYATNFTVWTLQVHIIASYRSKPADNCLFHCRAKMGVFETVYNQSPGPCRVMQGRKHNQHTSTAGLDLSLTCFSVNGSEDIVVLQNGHAFVSSVRIVLA